MLVWYFILILGMGSSFVAGQDPTETPTAPTDTTAAPVPQCYECADKAACKADPKEGTPKDCSGETAVYCTITSVAKEVTLKQHCVDLAALKDLNEKVHKAAMNDTTGNGPWCDSKRDPVSKIVTINCACKSADTLCNKDAIAVLKDRKCLHCGWKTPPPAEDAVGTPDQYTVPCEAGKNGSEIVCPTPLDICYIKGIYSVITEKGCHDQVQGVAGSCLYAGDPSGRATCGCVPTVENPEDACNGDEAYTPPDLQCYLCGDQAEIHGKGDPATTWPKTIYNAVYGESGDQFEVYKSLYLNCSQSSEGSPITCQNATEPGTHKLNACITIGKHPKQIDVKSCIAKDESKTKLFWGECTGEEVDQPRTCLCPDNMGPGNTAPDIETCNTNYAFQNFQCFQCDDSFVTNKFACTDSKGQIMLKNITATKCEHQNDAVCAIRRPRDSFLALRYSCEQKDDFFDDLLEYGAEPTIGEHKFTAYGNFWQLFVCNFTKCNDPQTYNLTEKLKFPNGDS